MELVTVRFDRIFDVVKGRKGRKPVTFFGFQFGDSKRYGVPAPGNPMLREGARVTALLGEAGNWQKLVGWYDHTSDEVVVESAAYEYFSLAWCLVASFMICPAREQSPLLVGAALGAFTIWAAWAARSAFNLWRASQLLQGAGKEPHGGASRGEF
jgi:hypothetical protein